MKFKNHFCSDIEKYCVELYQKRFPDSVQLGNIKNIDYSELIKNYGNKWITTGGFPCQPHSIAGKQKASKDERDLWPECFRMLSELRPKIALFENVPGLFISDGGRFFNGILSDISSIGHDCEWTVISAQDMGAPHKRERVWIVAYPQNREDDRRKSRIMGTEKRSWKSFNSAIDTCSKNVAYPDGNGYIHGQNEIESAESGESAQRNAGAKSKMANTPEPGLSQPQEKEQQERLLYAERGSSEIPDALKKHDDNSGYGASEIRRERPEKAEVQRQLSDTASQGLEREKSEGKFRRGESGLPAECDWWKFEPDVGLLVDGLPAGMDRYEGRLATKSYERVNQLKGLGNSIIPAIAKLLFEQIKTLL
jgi:DNA-cytosine methyltransferase